MATVTESVLVVQIETSECFSVVLTKPKARDALGHQKIARSPAAKDI